MPRVLAELPRWIFLALMFAGSALITAASLGYFDFEMLPPFVIEKLPLRFESLWLLSLRIHVASASLSFPLCLLLMTRALQKRPVWHRRLGRISGVLVLAALVPSGVVLAFSAKGGVPGTLGFLLSGAIVAGCMARGASAARRRKFASHRRAMRHVVAQMSVAVTSRALILGLDALGIDPELAYQLALWGPVLASAAVAEGIHFSSVPSPHLHIHNVERSRREDSQLARVLRLGPVVHAVARLGR